MSKSRLSAAAQFFLDDPEPPGTMTDDDDYESRGSFGSRFVSFKLCLFRVFKMFLSCLFVNFMSDNDDESRGSFGFRFGKFVGDLTSFCYYLFTNLLI
jgi:hypothetical protein